MEEMSVLIARSQAGERECVIYTLKKTDQDFQEILRRLEPDKRYSAMRELCNTIMVILDLVRFLIKSDYYSDEREYRIIQYSSVYK